MSTLGNFVVLQEGVPKSLRFSELYFVEKEIKDPLTKKVKRVVALQGDVIEEDGKEVRKVFSVTSEKLATALQPLLGMKDLHLHRVVITKHGQGFTTEYTVTII
jgi:hypothetical protein